MLLFDTTTGKTIPLALVYAGYVAGPSVRLNADEINSMRETVAALEQMGAGLLRSYPGALAEVDRAVEERNLKLHQDTRSNITLELNP